MSDNERDRSDEASIARLLRAAGRGPVASDGARSRIYRAVHAQWRASLGASAGGRRTTGRASAGLGFWLFRALPAAAAVAVAVVVFQVARTPQAGPRVELATVTKTLGTVTIAAPGADAAAPLSAGSSVVRSGDTISTGADGAAALALEGGPTLRVDSGTELLMASSEIIELGRGAVYLDAGSGTETGEALEIDTPFGTVRHLGTQYEVRVGDDSLQIRVREGTVGFRGPQSDGSEIVGVAGEQLLIAAGTDQPMRTAIATSGPAWQWVEGLAAAPAADRYPIIDLLRWIARETGRELEFSNAALAADARADALYGVAGLTPAETLDVIGSTTALRYELTDGVIRIY